MMGYYKVWALAGPLPDFRARRGKSRAPKARAARGRGGGGLRDIFLQKRQSWASVEVPTFLSLRDTGAKL